MAPTGSPLVVLGTMDVFSVLNACFLSVGKVTQEDLTTGLDRTPPQMEESLSKKKKTFCDHANHQPSNRVHALPWKCASGSWPAYCANGLTLTINGQHVFLFAFFFANFA
eukprot:EG_transcript_9715